MFFSDITIVNQEPHDSAESHDDTEAKEESPSSYSEGAMRNSIKKYEEKRKQEDIITDDSNTVTTGKVGSDWRALTESQKFHAVSNAMYSLDQSGYTITASEDSFINALDAFYSAGNNDVAVTEALIKIGLLSGTLYK